MDIFEWHALIMDVINVDLYHLCLCVWTNPFQHDSFSSFWYKQHINLDMETDESVTIASFFGWRNTRKDVPKGLSWASLAVQDLFSFTTFHCHKKDEDTTHLAKLKATMGDENMDNNRLIPVPPDNDQPPSPT